MTSPALAAISSISSAIPTLPTSFTSGVAAPDVSGASSTGGADFASVLGKGLDAVSQSQSTADNLAVQAATGDLTDISDYTIAATQASLMTSLATAIQSKGVEAFNQIMGMQA
ncbi:flagellar hook-basal body complex protein FliE [Jatrophihabitans sp. DSM 45814]